MTLYMYIYVHAVIHGLYSDLKKEWCSTHDFHSVLQADLVGQLNMITSMELCDWINIAKECVKIACYICIFIIIQLLV